MAKARMTKLWSDPIRDFNRGGAVAAYELRLDFDNDRHHALEIPVGSTYKEIVILLARWAEILQNDKRLQG